ncbi:MAG TPA: hypothetical protein VH328_04895 [Burkholderiaceae bacterium]|nr:hypothetical protein [Burkholderiaceae bacterium]
MLISIVNRTRALADRDVQAAVRVINRQFSDDFEPHWHFGARLRLDGHDRSIAAHERIAYERSQARGDGVIYLMDAPVVSGAEGVHDLDAQDVPYGFVFLDVCHQVKDPWTVALSHEALELVGDPLANLLVQGPHPEDHRHRVFHQFEMCDAVQDESYEIDGLPVSNFVLPAYFSRKHDAAARTDFMGRPARGDALRPFGLSDGGYLCFWDARRADDKWLPWWHPDDARAAERFNAKNASTASRAARRLHPRG